MAPITKVEGIGEVYGRKLAKAGVDTTEALLEKGATPEGRAKLARKTGISEKMLLQWINHVDLFRIKGIGDEYADLLEQADVNTVPELAQRVPEHLYARLAALKEEKPWLVRRLPSLAQVTDWVEQARKLPRKIIY